MVEGNESVVNYTPVTDLDYGTLLCTAKNVIGEQTMPCVFQIVAAGELQLPVSTFISYNREIILKKV